MITDAYYEAQQTEDVLDSQGGVSQSFESMITQADEKRHQDMMSRMQHANDAPVAQQPFPAAQPPAQPPQIQRFPVADPYTVLPQPPAPSEDAAPEYNPYPNAIHQSVIQPLEQESQLAADLVAPTPAAPAPEPEIEEKPAPTTSEKPISPDIINLANNTDLSIETIQREANRIQHKAEEDEGEVFISLH